MRFLNYGEMYLLSFLTSEVLNSLY